MYERTNGTVGDWIARHELCEEVGIPKELQEQISNYLREEELVELSSHRIAITHEGVKEIEESYKYPDKETTYFPALNIIMNQSNINVDNMTNSQIQQNSEHSTQNLKFIAKDKLPEIMEWMEKLETNIAELNTNDENKKVIQDQIELIKAESKKSPVEMSKIRNRLKIIRDLAINTAGSAFANSLLQWIKNL